MNRPVDPAAVPVHGGSGTPPLVVDIDSATLPPTVSAVALNLAGTGLGNPSALLQH